MQLNADQIKFFNENGFIELENIFSVKQAQQFTLGLLGLVDSQKCPGVDLKGYEQCSFEEQKKLLFRSLITLENTNHDYIKNIYDVLRETHQIKQFIASEKICTPVTQLLGLSVTAPLYMSQCACRIDMPYDKAFTLDWHQEVHYTIKDSDLIQLWAPAIEDITLETGALRILPGSHKVGVAKTKDFVPDFGHAQYTVVPEIVSQFEEKIVSMKFGNVLLLSNKLMHKSGVNSSKVPRLTLLTHYYNPSSKAFLSNFRKGLSKNDEKPIQNPYAKESETSL